MDLQMLAGSGFSLMDLEYVEERNEGAVGGLDQQELERVIIESDGLE